MAVITRRQPRIIGSTLNATKARFGGGPEAAWFKETAGQTFGIGDFIYLDANGTFAKATDAAGIMNGPVHSIATKAATGVAGTNVYGEIIRSDTILEMNIYHATPASALIAQTQLGQICQIKLVSGIWVVDVETLIAAAEAAAAALAKVRIIDFIDAIGDQYGKVKVVFIPFTHETDGGGLVRNLQGAN